MRPRIDARLDGIGFAPAELLPMGPSDVRARPRRRVELLRGLIYRGDQALRIIARHGDDMRPNVVVELWQAWRHRAQGVCPTPMFHSHTTL